MKDEDDAASTDRSSADASDLQSATSTSWSPHEVWLTRIKQPRDRAALRAATSAASLTHELSD
jgi:hypothetical protein